MLSLLCSLVHQCTLQLTYRIASPTMWTLFRCKKPTAASWVSTWHSSQAWPLDCRFSINKIKAFGDRTGHVRNDSRFRHKQWWKSSFNELQGWWLRRCVYVHTNMIKIISLSCGFISFSGFFFSISLHSTLVCTINKPFNFTTFQELPCVLCKPTVRCLENHSADLHNQAYF